MATAALLTRRAPTSAASKTLTLALGRCFLPSSSAPLADAAAAPRCLHSAASHGAIAPSDPRSGAPRADLSGPATATIAEKIWCYDHILQCHPSNSLHASMQIFPRWFSVKTQGGSGKPETCSAQSQAKYLREKDNTGVRPGHSDGEAGKSSPVLAFSPLEGRASGLRSESLKLRRIELSQKITETLIPILLIISKTKLTTSLLVLSVYWQIYGFFKEIFLDYVHQEVTRKWVLIYFKLLLLILAKETFLNFNMF